MTATTTTAFLPPNPPQKHNCKPCNCPTTTTQHPRNNAASHHSDLTRHELRGLVCDSVCLDHLLRPRLNISHCYPPMDSWEGTMCLIADGRWSLLRRESIMNEYYWTSLRPFSYHWTWNHVFINLAKCWEESKPTVISYDSSSILSWPLGGWATHRRRYRPTSFQPTGASCWPSVKRPVICLLGW